MNEAQARALKEHIVTVARELGAARVRVAAANPDERSRERMIASMERGDLAGWGYDAAYARRATDPKAFLSNARSVVCFAWPYAFAHDPRAAPLCGRVSNYAWSADYHSRVGVALRRIAGEIDEAAGAGVTAVACDTRPIAERAFAASAGLGWIGKHTNLIAPGLGSFVFLGEIVTTLDLPVDAPLRTSCGSCSRCVRSCPTGALRGDYTIDATRCISDLTQRTDGIPRAMRPLVGTWVWGCDLCQAVCPPSQRAGNGTDPRNAPIDAEAAAPPLIALLELRSGAFKRRFARTAMGWRGAAVLRRNAAVALGNAADRSAVPALVRALRTDPHPMVRGHSAWALGRIGSPSAFTALQGQLRVEKEESVREELIAALKAFERSTARGEDAHTCDVPSGTAAERSPRSGRDGAARTNGGRECAS